MANNRLYIYDPDTNKAVGLAKHMASGWYCYDHDTRDNNLQRKLEAWFLSLDGNAGWGDYEGTELQLLVENELPEDADIFNPMISIVK